MSLTEVLLSLAIMIAVIAGVAVNYASVREKADEQAVMQGIEMLRANVEQIYGKSDFTGLSNALLTSASAVPDSLLRGRDVRSPWGTIVVQPEEEGDGYTITLSSLPQSACRNLSTLSTTSWKSVRAGDTVLYRRGEATQFNPSAVLSACSKSSNTLTFAAP